MNSVYIRFQAAAPEWVRSPKHIPPPDKFSPEPKDADVMGPYYPTAEYTTKTAFETLGGSCE